MSSHEAVDSDALLSRLRVIEDQPLEQRAEAFGQVYEELRGRLEGEDTRGARPSGVAGSGAADETGA